MKEDFGPVSYALGWLSIIFGILIPISGLVLGIVGLVLSKKQTSDISKKAKILNIVGIVISIVVWVVLFLAAMYMVDLFPELTGVTA